MQKQNQKHVRLTKNLKPRNENMNTWQSTEHQALNVPE